MAERVAARVLVVEDDPAILRLMQQVLSQDFNVFTAASGEEALAVLRAERVHAVVADQMLPGIVGVELLRQVSVEQPHAARILVTASARVEDAQDAINVAKVKRFLAKPFRTGELLSTVGEAVHEAALGEIKTQLVAELKERNSHLSRTLEALEVRDQGLLKKLEGLAFRDGLTSLFTHRYFQEALSAELARVRRRTRCFALLFADVDGFRAYNLARGYAEGDALLRELARLLAVPEVTPVRSASPQDIAARYGSNRFSLLLPQTERARALETAERIRAGAERLELPGGARITVSVSVALFPEHGGSEQALIQAGERALREAKAAGGNRVEVASAE
ncbi:MULTISPECIES: diguanylate cyclase [Myxococcaceae]|uniref:GGDEF domain-containing response regulator n=1 Tax=Myxococcaceae TaxID=31 RepID=UPI00188DF8A1|nr:MULTISPECIES: diguanylate cyclase [Myxococcaceae]MBF5044998.1 diguanylate cyclase [Simulacricoccus sp. 17bor-14]